MTRAITKPTGTPTVKDLAARVEALTIKVDALTGHDGKQDQAGEGREPQYSTVEEWVRDYLLPTFSRPTGELGAGGRWRWCEQWWRHDEAVTILTALWYGWEHAALQVTGMLDWLPRLYYFLPILCGDDAPFRLCAPAIGDLPARHDIPPIAEVTPAPAGWWNWWSDSPAAAGAPTSLVQTGRIARGTRGCYPAGMRPSQNREPKKLWSLVILVRLQVPVLLAGRQAADVILVGLVEKLVPEASELEFIAFQSELTDTAAEEPRAEPHTEVLGVIAPAHRGGTSAGRARRRCHHEPPRQDRDLRQRLDLCGTGLRVLDARKPLPK